MESFARHLGSVSIAALVACGGSGGASAPSDFLEPCGLDFECEGDACIAAVGGGGMCSLRCESSAQCPDGWQCTVFDERTFACQCPAGGCPGLSAALPATHEIDLLLVIDNSNSMTEEQASFEAELPSFVSALAPAAASVRIGVVSTDMGVGGHDVPTCDGGTFGSAFGDDAVLSTRGRTAMPGCAATYPAVLSFGGSEDPFAIAEDLACVASMGVGGCGFEQQLDAALKAVSPAAPTAWTRADYEPPLFALGTRGHADGANAGFVRAGSVLAIVILTDEEDCSASNPNLFDPSSAEFAGTDLNLRCFTHPEAVHPIARYASGLLGLRGRPERLVLGVIAGVPPEALGSSGTIDYDAVLAHPDMIEAIDPAMPTRLRPSCNVPGRGLAFPPRRMVQVAQQIDDFGGRATVQSICQDDLGNAMDAIAREIVASAAAH